MAQDDLIVANAGGATVRAKINSALAALGSGMKGPTAPSSPLAGMIWVEDDVPSVSVWTVRMYDGADWIALGQLDSTNNRFTPSGIFAAGSAGTPGFVPAGDTNTGLWAPAADTLAISTGGTERLRIADALATLAVPLELPAADPASANHAARKTYVDAGDVWARIADVAVTAVTTIDVTWTASLYRAAEIIFDGVLPGTLGGSGSNLLVQIRVGGAWASSAYVASILAQEGNVVGAVDYAGLSAWYLTLAGNHAGGDHNSGRATVFLGAGTEPGLIGHSRNSSPTGGRRHQGVAGSHPNAGPVEGLRFSWEDGSSFGAVGRIQILGLKA